MVPAFSAARFLFSICCSTERTSTAKTSSSFGMGTCLSAISVTWACAVTAGSTSRTRQIISDDPPSFYPVFLPSTAKMPLICASIALVSVEQGYVFLRFSGCAFPTWFLSWRSWTSWPLPWSCGQSSTRATTGIRISQKTDGASLFLRF